MQLNDHKAATVISSRPMKHMKAMVLERIGKPLRLRELAVPVPGPEQVLVKVTACGVCRTDLHVADDDLTKPPLLCAGLIGYRALRFAGAAEGLGIYGFGVAAHIVAQVAIAEGRRIYAFTKPGDNAAQDFATSLGCDAAFDSDKPVPGLLDAAIIFAPAGSVVQVPLASLRKGGTLVLGGIHMSEIPALPYRLLWGERTMRSVANRADDADARAPPIQGIPIAWARSCGAFNDRR
jgi:D-arabinose 1-dehydrogenase-like Zn-dependent alcohol dehydrogenase